MPIQGRFVEERKVDGQNSGFICLESCLERFGRATVAGSSAGHGMTWCAYFGGSSFFATLISNSH